MEKFAEQRKKSAISVPIPLHGPNKIKCLCPLRTVFAIIFLFLLLMEIRSRKMTFSIRLRHNENEEEIPITEMYSPVSELYVFT